MLQRLMGFCESLLLIACQQRASLADAATRFCFLYLMRATLIFVAVFAASEAFPSYSVMVRTAIQMLGLSP
jgi:hypothetical protein